MKCLLEQPAQLIKAKVAADNPILVKKSFLPMTLIR
jgi:hypothetical protein